MPQQVQRLLVPQPGVQGLARELEERLAQEPAQVPRQAPVAPVVEQVTGAEVVSVALSFRIPLSPSYDDIYITIGGGRQLVLGCGLR